MDPVKLAYTQLQQVHQFLQDQDFEEQADRVADVLDQLVGWCAKRAQLDARYPDAIQPDSEWRKANGISNQHS
jgi:hypothetical protein